MSEQSSFPLFVKDNLEKHPEVFTINQDELNKKLAEGLKARQALEAKHVAYKPTDLRKEYNDLRKQLFDLTEHAKNCEIRVNNEAGNVHHFETLVNDLLTKKKAATAENRLGDERYLERLLVRTEEELQDARERLIKEQRYNKAAVRALRTFDGQTRLAELKKELGI